MKELIINGKTFHFSQYESKKPNWDSTFDLDIESATKELENKENQPLPPCGFVRYYGMDGFKGLISLEPATTDECGRFDLEEQLEAAKQGCNIIYQYEP